MTQLAETVTFAGVLEGSMLQEQIALEHKAAHEGAERYRKLVNEAVDRGEGATLKPAEKLVVYWLPHLVKAIRKEQGEVQRGHSGCGRAIYGPVLLQVDAERAAVAALHEAIGRCLLSGEGMRVASAAYKIGHAVVAEACYDKMKEDNADELKKLTSRCNALSPRVIVKWYKQCMSEPVWNKRVCAHLGSMLLWLIQVTCMIKEPGSDKLVLAFRHTKRYEGKREIGFITLTKQAHRVLERGHIAREMLRPRLMPMVVEPMARRVAKDKHGSALFQGGFLLHRTPYIAKATREQRHNLIGRDLKRVNDGLDALQRTAWKVNGRMLDVIVRVYNKFGGGVAGMPRSHDRPIPPRPAECDNDKAIHKAWCKRASLVYKENAEARGERFQIEQLFSSASRFSEYEKLWIPHHCDFRGRVYPTPETLHHHKGDIHRSLLLFGNPVKANRDDARWWIYVHAANCAGRDKLSYEDRVKWTDEWIKAYSAQQWINDPEQTCELARDTWSAPDIENPCQFLAAIMAIFDPDLASHLPVQLDATCSALQHYAAMALDAEAAMHVNLIDSNAPNGIYAIAAERMEARRAKDMVRANGANKDMAKMAEGLIDKAMAKSPTMTTSYGATTYGIHEQIFDKLGEWANKPGREALKDYKVRHELAKYIRGLASEAIVDACPSATRIMGWIKGQARAIATAGFALKWISPNGFPVIQSYRRTQKFQIKTLLQMISYDGDPEKAPVRVAKQARAAAPNVVHSFDAAHGLAVAAEARRANIEMGLVHDCFWQHAANVDANGVIIRENFIRQYSIDQLAGLYEQWKAMYPTVKIEPPPERVGTFDLNNVMGAKYAVS